jgi:hypothetical protein
MTLSLIPEVAIHTMLVVVDHSGGRWALCSSIIMQKSRFHSTPKLSSPPPAPRSQAKLGCSEVQVGSQNECSEIAEKTAAAAAAVVGQAAFSDTKNVP